MICCIFKVCGIVKISISPRKVSKPVVVSMIKSKIHLTPKEENDNKLNFK